MVLHWRAEELDVAELPYVELLIGLQTSVNLSGVAYVVLRNIAISSNSILQRLCPTTAMHAPSCEHQEAIVLAVHFVLAQLPRFASLDVS